MNALISPFGYLPLLMAVVSRTEADGLFHGREKQEAAVHFLRSLIRVEWTPAIDAAARAAIDTMITFENLAQGRECT